MLPCHHTPPVPQPGTRISSDTPILRRDCRCARARHVHGTVGAYKRDRCRCSECTAANTSSKNSAARRAAVRRWQDLDVGWVPAAGTKRRLQALSRAGWSAQALADELGVHRSAVLRLRTTAQERVSSRTADDVCELYERCWWRTPTGRYELRTERYAERAGWAGPWQWTPDSLDDPAAEPIGPTGNEVDQVVVERIIAGDPPTHWWPCETHAVVLELTRLGESAAVIAQRLQLADARTVQYHRHRLGLTA